MTVTARDLLKLREQLARFRRVLIESEQKPNSSEAMSVALAVAAAAAKALAATDDREVAKLGGDILRSVAIGEAALQMRSRGGVSPERADAILERDELLLRLARLDGMLWAPLPPGPAARAMRLSFDRYESSRWLRERDALGAPPTEPSATWWRVLQSAVPMPGSDRLRQILSREIQSTRLDFAGTGRSIAPRSELDREVDAMTTEANVARILANYQSATGARPRKAIAPDTIADRREGRVEAMATGTAVDRILANYRAVSGAAQSGH